MYEFVKAGDFSGYFSCPAKIGLYTKGNDAYLIDSGNDKDAAKKVLKSLESMGLDLKAVLVTHSHADHIGGCSFLQEKTGCRIYSRGIEKAFTEFPILEPSFLYGAVPPDELCHKFLLAKPSKTEDFTLPEGIETFELHGHSYDMIGYKTVDSIVFLADALSSRATLEKYPLAFTYDVRRQLETLEYIKTLDARVFVPSHADATDDITPLANINTASIRKNCELILTLCKDGVSFETLLARILEKLSIAMTFEQNALCSCALRAYLTYLKGENKLSFEICDNRFFIKAI